MARQGACRAIRDQTNMNIAAPGAGISGLACLAAIARFHDLDVSEPHLLQLISPGPDGRVTPGNLVQGARKVGLTAKLVRMSWSRLGRLGQALPAILILRNGEVILIKRKYALSDPGQPFGLKWFIPEFLRQRRAFVDVIVAALSLHVLALASLIFFQLMIDRVVVHRVEATMIVLTVGVALAVAFEAALGYARGLVLLYATSKIDIRLATAVFQKMISLPVDFFERNLAGIITKHMQQDQRIREFLSGRLLLTVLDATALFVFLPILFYYSVSLTLVVLLCASLIAGIIGVLASTFRRRLTELYRAEGERQALLIEAIHGITTVKAL